MFAIDQSSDVGLWGCGESYILLIQPLLLTIAPSILCIFAFARILCEFEMACAYKGGTGRCLSFLGQVATPALVSDKVFVIPLSHFLKYYG